MEIWSWAAAHRHVGKDAALCTLTLLRDLEGPSGPPEDQWGIVGLNLDGGLP